MHTNKITTRIALEAPLVGAFVLGTACDVARASHSAMENHRKQGHDAMVHSTGRYYSTSAL